MPREQRRLTVKSVPQKVQVKAVFESSELLKPKYVKCLFFEVNAYSWRDKASYIQMSTRQMLTVPLLCGQNELLSEGYLQN